MWFHLLYCVQEFHYETIVRNDQDLKPLRFYLVNVLLKCTLRLFVVLAVEKFSHNFCLDKVFSPQIHIFP